MKSGDSDTMGTQYQLPIADRDPSGLGRRRIAAVVALTAFAIACYLGSFQAGFIGSVWDPVFGDGSEKVLLSKPALLLRSIILIPDAWMGSIAYLGAAVFAIAGPSRRYARRPWLAVIFGANVASLGFASTILVLVQGLVIGEWCLLCLAAAACSYTLVLLAAGEVWATLKHICSAWNGSESIYAFLCEVRGTKRRSPEGRA